MKRNNMRMTNEEYDLFIKSHPNVKQSDIRDMEDILLQRMYGEMAFRAQNSEIEFLKNKALRAMGTDGEMKFSDIESGMLQASLSDGRNALKEILEKTPVEAPTRADGTKMKNQGRKKKQ